MSAANDPMETSGDDLLVEIPAPAHEASLQIARFLVELFGERALAELGLLPGIRDESPR